ncbi:MAG: multidrug efflux MFS transporter [Thermoleophilia bacterium]|nr:multidrug efflux MFS transporter [Thermoleophilia bacterium]
MLLWLVLATFTVILNETIMMNALPRLMVAFHTDARTVQWLTTAFMLTMAVVIPATGWFLQRVDTRTAYTLAMGVFCGGTLLAAVAWAFPVLVAARVIQAAGTAIMMPLLMTTLMVIVPPARRGQVMGLVTLAISVAPAMGPTASGVILEFASWRWIFWFVLPIAVVMTVLGRRNLPSGEAARQASLDVLSVALSAVGFGAFVYGLSQLGAEGHQPVSPVLAVVVGVAGLALFVARQIALQRGGGPLLDLRTLAVGRFTLCLAIMSVAFMGMLGVMILLPLYLQDVRGVGVLETGLLMMPGGVAMGLLGPVVGRLFDARGARVLVIPGCVLILAVLLGFTRVTVSTPVWSILALHVGLMVGLAFAFTPLFTVGLSALPGHLYSHGSSMVGTAQQLAAAAGAALVVNVMSSRATDLAKEGKTLAEATAGGMRGAFWLDAGICALMLVLTLFLPGRGATAAGHGHGHGPAPEDPAAEPSA